MRKRRFLALISGAVVAPRAFAQESSISFVSVQEEARRLAAEPYRRVQPSVSPQARQLNYEQYRAIRFRSEKALWANSKSLFRAEFFPTGLIYDTPVSIYAVSEGKSVPVTASPDMFESPQNIGMPALAGFRLTHPLHGARFDEIAAFLGASYFRPIGREQTYGASARGLAIDTGLPRTEEFPAFRAFWLVEPAPGQREVTVWALLDSPGATGAYAFTIRPGTRTVIDTAASLYIRHGIAVLGMAPLTSMFFTGKNTTRTAAARDDFRPEVHDSDGLALLTGAGERIWRPLGNPQGLAVSAFADRNPRGFGLMQRERAFAQYQDEIARYHTRPSLWVEPIGDWGDGDVRLIEIPTDSEVHDNIVAFWAPRAAVKPGDRLDFRYRLSALADEASLSPLARVAGTRIGTVPSAPPRQRRVVIEFAGGDLDVLRAEQPVEGSVSVTGARLVRSRVEAVAGHKTWRLLFDIEPEGKRPVELRAFLALRGEAISETWTYAVRP